MARNRQIKTTDELSNHQELVALSQNALVGIQKQTLVLATIAHQGLQRKNQHPLWDVAHLEKQIRSKGLEAVLGELRLLACDPDIQPLFRAVLRIAHLLRRRENPDDFLVLWRDRCFQQGWDDVTEQADMLLAQRNKAYLHRLYRYQEASNWYLNIEADSRNLQALCLRENLIITATAHSIRLWDQKTGVSLGSLQVDQRIHAIDVDLAEQQIAACTAAGEVFVWTIKDLQLQSTFSLPGVSLLCFDHQGHQLAAAAWNKQVSIIDLRSQAQHPLTLPDTPSSLAFAYGDQQLAIGMEDGQIVIWDLAQNRQELHLISSDVTITALQFDIDPQKIVIGGENGCCWLWNRQPYFIAELDAPIQHISLQHTMLIASTMQHVSAWQLNEGYPQQAWQLEQLESQHCALSDDGHYWLNSLPDGTAQLWENPTTLHEKPSPVGEISAIHLHPQGQSIALGRQDGLLQVWDAASGQVELQLPQQDHSIIACHFTAEGLWTGQANGTLKLWSAIQQEAEIQLPSEWIDRMLFCASGIVTTHWDGSLCFWDYSGNRKHHWPGDQSQILTMDLEPDKQQLAIGTFAGSIYILDVHHGSIQFRQAHSGPAVTALQFQRKRLCIARENGFIGLWQAQYGWAWERELSSPVHTLAADPNAHYLLSGTADRFLRIWSSGSGGQLGTLALPHRIKHIKCNYGNRIIATTHDQIHFLQWMLPDASLH